MEFKLPEALLGQVVSYDKVLKYASKKSIETDEQKAQRRLKLIGVIDCLLPEELMSKESQAKLITNIINDSHGDNSRLFWTVHHSEFTAYFAYVYSSWRAYWFPKDKADYYYGFSIGFKDTKAKREKFDATHATCKLFNNSAYTLGSHSELISGSCQGSKYLVYTFKFNHEVLMNTMEDRNPSFPLGHQIINSRLRALYPLRNAFTKFVNSFNLHLNPVDYEGISHKFNNILINKDPVKLFVMNIKSSYSAEYSKFANLVDFNSSEPTKDGHLAIAAILKRLHEDRMAKYTKNTSVLDTPFFRRQFVNAAKQYIDKVEGQIANNSRVKNLHEHRLASSSKMGVFAKVVAYAPEVSIDKLQLLYLTLQSYDFYINGLEYAIEPEVMDWFRKYNALDTCINLIISALNNNRQHGEDLQSLNDAFRMIDRVVASGQNLEKPKRWRLETLHDHLCTESFKVSTPNEVLPQLFFPEPVTILFQSKKFTFIQPQSLHQLAGWGAAVRNCVGNVSAYSNGIKKKTHFIFLAMVDQKPVYTVQASLNNGTMKIDQIVGLSNKRLDDSERLDYQQAFSMAIEARNSQLC